MSAARPPVVSSSNTATTNTRTRSRRCEIDLQRIRRDVESGIAPGEVSGTPTLFIDGVVHRGGYDTAMLLEALDG
jgi:glutaredoxin